MTNCLKDKDIMIDESSTTNVVQSENKDTQKLSSTKNNILKNGETKSFKALNNSIKGNISSGQRTINL